MTRSKAWICAGVVWTVCVALASPSLASSYQMTTGRIVNAIMDLSGNVHAYDGPDLGPGVDASGLDLSLARLKYADLVGAVLATSNLTGAHLTYSRFHGADLSWANLTDVTGLALYDSGTEFEGAFETVCDLHGSCADQAFDPVGAGWVLSPEPATGLLCMIGLSVLGFRKRSGRSS